MSADHDDVDNSPSSGSRAEGKLFKLNGTNFGEWKADTMAELQEKGHWPQIEDEKKSSKDAANVKARGFIIRRIAFDLQHHIPDAANAAEAWKAICNQYEQVGAAQKIRLLTSLFSNRLVPGAKVDPWLHSMRQGFQRLALVKTVFDDETQAGIILSFLPPDWSTLVTTLCAASKPGQSTGLTVARLTIELQEEEKRREDVEKIAINAASTSLVARTAESLRDRCNWCLKPGHSEIDCYAKRDGKPRNTVPPPPRIRGRGPRRSANVVGEESNTSSRSFQSHVFIVTSTAANDSQPSHARVLSTSTNVALSINQPTETRAQPVTNINKSSEWYVDSGASEHYCNNRELFTTFTASSGAFVTVGDGYNLAAEGIGNVQIKTLVNDQAKTYLPVTFTKVMYVPTLAVNLLSVSRMDDAGLTVSFNQGKCAIQSRKSNGLLIGTALKVDSKLWRLATIPSTEVGPDIDIDARCNAVGIESKEDLAILWHRRLAHLHFRAIHVLFDQDMAADTGSLSKLPKAAPDHDPTQHCESCVLGKHHRSSIPGDADHRATKPLHRVHIDVCGPFSVKSHFGASYLLLVVDDYSRYTWARSMSKKDQAFDLFKEYVATTEAMHANAGYRVSILRSDNGGEFMSNAFSEWLATQGIRRERTNAYSPWQNGVVERMNRRVVEAARAMLADAKLPVSFWSLACHAAVYAQNRSPTSSLPAITPYEAWHGEKPFIGHMRIFGCSAYRLIRKDERGNKFEPAAEACIFVGYSPDSTAYRLWDGHKVIESRDVHFAEDKLGVAERRCNEIN
jgi:hypothetical protein